MLPVVKCIVEGCAHNGKIWVNKEGPYCYTHHHELNKTNKINKETYKKNEEEANIIILKPLQQ